ncbi:MAG: DUF1552 domain-containing protein [Sandaracinaceae bacterium]
MKVSRRMVLRGAGGAMMTLPFLEGLAGRRSAEAQDIAPPFVIFLRQANGVAAAQNTPLGTEPERFWPRQEGPLTPDNLADRALDELTEYRQRLLVVGNVNMGGFDFGDGHARGALQCLTASGPTVNGAGGQSEAAGESIDHRIGRELNPDGRDSMFLYAGRPGGWLGGPCISYRAAGQRRSAIHSPHNAYMSFASSDDETPDAQRRRIQRGQSVNDVLRAQLDRVLASSRLSSADRRRLETHRSAIRELEVSLSCRLSADEERALEGIGDIHESNDGDEVLAAVRLHMDVAALAVACGVTRSIAIQVGSGNDGSTRYRNRSGDMMENFHYLSHRRLSHDSSGAVINNADELHHLVDRQFAATFRHLLDRLSSYPTAEGRTLLDDGLAVWLNDLGNGPGHSRMSTPFILGGGCGGYFKQGEYIRVSGGERVDNHAQLLNTIATAVGVRRDGGPLDNFGDPGLPGGLLDELRA